MKKTLTSSAYVVPAVIIFVAVTALYWMKYDGTGPQDAGSDCLIYWMTYAIVMLFLQFVIYVNAKRQLQRGRDH